MKTDFEFYAPDAQKVYVVGNFNDWSETKTPLKKGLDGKWKRTLALPAGRHEYRYLVDGVWQNDQRPGECVPNAFGSVNCIIEA